MSETPETANTEQTAPAQEQRGSWESLFEGQDPQEVKEALENSRKWERRAKDNKDAADKLAEIEESKKTEIQKAMERAEQAEQRINELEREKTRLSVIASHGIPEDYQDLIKGDSEEELAASAEKVKSLIESAAQKQGPEQASYVIPAEGGSPASLPLNGDGIEASLKKALGI